jgi:predicted Zn-dependent protease
MLARAAALLALASAALCAAGCITDPVTGKSVIGMPMSDAEENATGLSYRPMIVQEYTGAYPDPAMQSYLGGIVLPMARASVRPELSWAFTVLNSSVPNAFAVPGGQVFITRGLLWRLDDEAEFAVVMGHEIGHVEHRHSVQGMARDPIIAILGGLAGEAVGVPELGAVAANLGISGYSREQERESDGRGVHNAYRAGYDPREGADVFRKFQQMKEEAGGSEDILGAWFSTHPLDSERIESIPKLAAAVDPRLAGTQPVPGLRVQTPQFAQLITRLRAEQKVYDRLDAAVNRIGEGGSADDVRAAIPEMDACARALPGHAYFSSKLGMAYLAAGDNQSARTWLERAASMGQEILEPEYLLSVMALNDKDYARALDRAQRGLSILPGDYRCTYLRGEALFASGRTAEAQRDFQAVLESAPAQSMEYKGAAARIQGSQPAQPKKAAKKTKKKK